MVGQIDRVRTGDDGQSFGQVVAVWEVQVEHVANFGVLKGNTSQTIRSNWLFIYFCFINFLFFFSTNLFA